MRSVGAPQVVDSGVLEACGCASRFPPPTERHLRNSEHTVIPGHPTALLTIQDLPHRFRGDNHPRFAALALPNGDNYAILAKLADIRPFEALYLALAHPRVDGPEDEVGQPSGLL